MRGSMTCGSVPSSMPNQCRPWPTRRRAGRMRATASTMAAAARSIIESYQEWFTSNAVSGPWWLWVAPTKTSTVPAPRGGEPALHLGADRVGVGPEDHVEVGGEEGHHLLVARPLEREGTGPHVVVHPVRLGVAVADRDPAVVPLGDEHARRHRVAQAREPRAAGRSRPPSTRGSTERLDAPAKMIPPGCGAAAVLAESGTAPTRVPSSAARPRRRPDGVGACCCSPGSSERPQTIYDQPHEERAVLQHRGPVRRDVLACRTRRC